MLRHDPAWLSILSDVLSNLAAGWFGLVVVTPAILELTSSRAILTLAMNIGFGMFALVLAVKLRRLANNIL